MKQIENKRYNSIICFDLDGRRHRVGMWALKYNNGYDYTEWIFHGSIHRINGCSDTLGGYKLYRKQIGLNIGKLVI